MSAPVPGVFVSSTCYDLAQVRADLHNFIVELGYTPFLSEFDSFPVDPSAATAENCVVNVEKHADIFVLVVGDRYGSMMPGHDRSVTNMEYLTARRCAVPVYAFVLRSVLDAVPLWRDNRTGDFTRVVDSPKVFEFVEELRGAEGVWVFPFALAQDIKARLREQLGVLVKELLDLRRKVVTRPMSAAVASLGPAALRVAIEQPREWETRLVHAVVSEELERLRPKRFDLAHGIDATKRVLVDDRALLEMVHPATQRLTGFVSIVQQIVEGALPAAEGSDNAPARPDELVFVARRFASSYGDVLELAIQLRHLRIEPESAEARTVVVELLGWAEALLASIERYVETLGAALVDLLSKPPLPPGTRLPVKLTISIPDPDPAVAATDALLKKYAASQGVTQR